MNIERNNEDDSANDPYSFSTGNSWSSSSWIMGGEKCIEFLEYELEEFFRNDMGIGPDWNWELDNELKAAFKNKSLRENFRSFRRVKGDGNCYYRWLMFAAFESYIRRLWSRDSNPH